jgi:hypothetical protein
VVTMRLALSDQMRTNPSGVPQASSPDRGATTSWLLLVPKASRTTPCRPMGTS